MHDAGYFEIIRSCTFHIPHPNVAFRRTIELGLNSDVNNGWVLYKAAEDICSGHTGEMTDVIALYIIK